MRTALPPLLALACLTSTACGSGTSCALTSASAPLVLSLATLVDAGLFDPSWTCAQACFVAEQLPTSDSCSLTYDGSHILCGDGTELPADDAGAPQDCLAACQRVYVAEELQSLGTSNPYASCELLDAGGALRASCTPHAAGACGFDGGAL